MIKPLNLVLIGRSGCGKGTQAKLLVKYLSDTHYISTGDLMRELAEKDTVVGRLVKKVLEEGGLVPSEIAIGLWMSDLANNVTVKKSIIFDGLPRDAEEAVHLDNTLKFMQRYDNFRVLLIDISRTEAFKRLKLRARADDHEEAINNRLDYYEEHVVPVIEHYEKTGKLIKINGEQAVERIHEDIKETLQI